MAIKGKKKPRSGSSRRRPAGAPRVMPGTGRRVPWYRTTRGRVGAGIVGGLVLLVLVLVALNARSDARALDERREALERYTGQVRALLGRVQPTVADMTGLPEEPSDKELQQIAEDARVWADELAAVSTTTADMTPPEGLEGTQNLLLIAVRSYEGAARTFGLAASAEGDLVPDLLTRARDQQGRGDGIWLTLIDLLNARRIDAGLNASSMTAPGISALRSPPVPTPEPTDGG